MDGDIGPEALLRAFLARLADGVASAATRLAAGELPAEAGLFAAGIGLALLVPAVGQRFGRSSRTDFEITPPRWRRPTPRRSATASRHPPRGEAPSAQARRLHGPLTGRARVVDGDTVVIRGVRIRLHGIDAPEMDQKGGDAARKHLVALIADRSVTAVPLDVDIHGRTVARLEAEGSDLCRAMVADGFAIAYRRYSRAYVWDERRARARRRGLWAVCALKGIENPAAHRYRVREANRP